MSPGSWGALEPCSLPGPASTTLVWQPDKRLTGLVEANYRIHLTCVRGEDGHRRWYHTGIVTREEVAASILPHVALGGMAILQLESPLEGADLKWYRVLLLLFNFRRSFQEHFKRRFTGWNDLVTGARDDADEGHASVLSVVHPKLTYSKLWKAGQAAAEACGIKRPSREQVVSLGLCYPPSELTQDLDQAWPPCPTTSEMIRKALFDLDLSDAELDSVLAHPLVPRLLKAIEDHQDDDQDAFNKWFERQKNHGFKSLARHKKASGGPLDEDEAKQIVLGLVWQAYEYIARCVDRQMRAIRDAIQPPLNPQEQVLYARMHLAQPVLGNLPWLVVSERTSVLWAWMRRWAEDPEYTDEAPANRLLRWYAAMVRRRRDIDSERKMGRKERISTDSETTSGRPLSTTFAADGPDPADTVSDRDAVQALIQRLVSPNGMVCPNGCGVMEPVEYGSAGENLQVDFRCRCGHRVSRSFALAIVRQVAQQLDLGIKENTDLLPEH